MFSQVYVQRRFNKFPPSCRHVEVSFPPVYHFDLWATLSYNIFTELQLEGLRTKFTSNSELPEKQMDPRYFFNLIDRS